jgi:hypothetical protein
MRKLRDFFTKYPPFNIIEFSPFCASCQPDFARGRFSAPQFWFFRVFQASPAGSYSFPLLYPLSFLGVPFDSAQGLRLGAWRFKNAAAPADSVLSFADFFLTWIE